MNLTSYESACRERDLMMQRKPYGAMCLVAAIVLGAMLVMAGLLGWGIAWIVERL